MKRPPTTIIVEAGVNHNGSIATAKKMIDAALEVGADLVKFQTFKADALVTKFGEKADYQKELLGNEGSQFEMLKNLELDLAAHKELIKHCEKGSIRFMSTPFDHDSIDLLGKLNLPFFKIPSGEITNLPYLQHIGIMGKPIIMSSGMCTLKEIRVAMNVLIDAGVKKSDLTIMHCNTEYPTPIVDVNLNAMLTIRDELDVKVGYSDHTLGIEVPIAAVSLGASVIEKHFTLNRSLPGPDHAASLEPVEMKAMVVAIRNIERAMGDGVKKPSPSEIKNIPNTRKSIVAKKPIKKGDYFSEDNLTVKRPGTGISPMEWRKIIGKISKKDYKIEDFIEN